MNDNVYPLRIADAKKSIRHVFVRDLEIEAHIGVYRHEHGRRNPYGLMLISRFMKLNI